jgi:hypothetical protein
MNFIDEILEAILDRRSTKPPGSEPEPDESRWQLKYRSKDRRLEVFHLDGVAWHDAPLPDRIHRCQAQTRAWTNWFTRVERCACGSLRCDKRGPWIDKNERRKDGER